MSTMEMDAMFKLFHFISMARDRVRIRRAFDKLRRCKGLVISDNPYQDKENVKPPL